MAVIRRGTALAVAVCAAMTLAVWFAPTARAGREQTVTYVAATEPLVTTAAVWATGVEGARVVCLPVEETVGGSGACFPVQPGESEVRVRIHDTITPLARGELRFFDARGERIGDDIGFCRRFRADIPAAAAAAVVQVLPYACEPAGGTIPVSGRIVAYFE